jgi:hypothetical protein
MQIIRDFCPSDRYTYDFGLCSITNGWAQIDTSQDASYYGQWISPTKRAILCYCEGDVILTKCESDAELVEEMHKMRAWNDRPGGHTFMGIDPGFNATLKSDLISCGLESFLH